VLELDCDLLLDGGSNNAGGDVLVPAAASDINVHGFLNDQLHFLLNSL
jgi:hypothetical protein